MLSTIFFFQHSNARCIKQYANSQNKAVCMVAVCERRWFSRYTHHNHCPNGLGRDVFFYNVGRPRNATKGHNAVTLQAYRAAGWVPPLAYIRQGKCARAFRRAQRIPSSCHASQKHASLPRQAVQTLPCAPARTATGPYPPRSSGWAHIDYKQPAPPSFRAN